MAPLAGELLLFHHREQELLVFLGVHIFPGNEYAGDLHKILRLLPLRDAHGLLHGHVAHVERPLDDDGLDDVLLEQRDLPLRIVAADDEDLAAHAELDERVRRAHVADLVRAHEAPDVRLFLVVISFARRVLLSQQ